MHYIKDTCKKPWSPFFEEDLRCAAPHCNHTLSTLWARHATNAGLWRPPKDIPDGQDMSPPSPCPPRLGNVVKMKGKRMKKAKPKLKMPDEAPLDQ